MKAKLIKTPEQLYKLEFYNDEDMLACATALLSKQNCDEIFGVVDVEKLADELYNGHVMAVDWQLEKRGFKDGFNKAMELNKDKVFTINDVMLAWDAGVTSKGILGMFGGDLSTKHLNSHRDSYKKSLQEPTEIEVEIEMDILNEYDQPQLDSEGYLILKKI